MVYRPKHWILDLVDLVEAFFNEFLTLWPKWKVYHQISFAVFLTDARKRGYDQLIGIIQADQEYILLIAISVAYPYLKRALSKFDMWFMANIKIWFEI